MARIIGQDFLPGLIGGLNSALDRNQRQELIDLQKEQFAFKRIAAKLDQDAAVRIGQLAQNIFADSQDEIAGGQIRGFVSEISGQPPKLAKQIAQPQLDKLEQQGVKIPKETVDLVVNAKPDSPEAEAIKELASRPIGGEQVLNTLANPELTAEALIDATKEVKRKESLSLLERRKEVTQKRLGFATQRVNKFIKRLQTALQIPEIGPKSNAEKTRFLSLIKKFLDDAESRRNTAQLAVGSVLNREQSQAFQGEQQEDRQVFQGELQEGRQSFQRGQADAAFGRQKELVGIRATSQQETARIAREGQTKQVKERRQIKGQEQLDFINEASDIITELQTKITDKPSLVGFRGSLRAPLQRLVGVAKDFGSTVVSPLANIAKDLALDESDLTADQEFEFFDDPTIPTLEIIENSIGMINARLKTSAGQRVPVEVIKQSIKEAKLTGFRSSDDVVRRLDFILGRLSSRAESVRGRFDIPDEDKKDKSIAIPRGSIINGQFVPSNEPSRFAFEDDKIISIE